MIAASAKMWFFPGVVVQKFAALRLASSPSELLNQDHTGIMGF